MLRPPNFPNLRKNIARRGAFFLPLLIVACHAGGTNGSSIPGDRSDTRPYEGVAPGDTLRFTGTEPFWGGEVKGDRMIYKTPEKPDGETVTVSRFNGRGGFSYSAPSAARSSRWRSRRAPAATACRTAAIPSSRRSSAGRRCAPVAPGPMRIRSTVRRRPEGYAHDHAPGAAIMPDTIVTALLRFALISCDCLRGSISPFRASS
jgi:hypothetical protein